VLEGLAPSSQTVACNKGEKETLQCRKSMRHYDQTITMQHSVQPHKNATLWHATKRVYAPFLHATSLHVTSCINVPLVHAPKDHPTAYYI
jgi:hypothetical protein